MTVSMTGFAAAKGQGQGYAWAWDIRAVNGKGLDLRLRVPDIDGLEAALRAEMAQVMQRGTVSLALKLARDTGAAAPLRVNLEVLRAVLLALGTVEQVAMESGVTLAQASQADVLAMRGVFENTPEAEDQTALRAALLAEFPTLLADFNAMRAREGAALNVVIAQQLDLIDSLTRAAEAAVQARRDQQSDMLRSQIARILGNADALDETRLAGELALLAVKTDITEELDRLKAHCAAARLLLDSAGPVGRKFDFLMQEFMREANTLCSKSQDIALTRIGLDLKTVIDQMREQVQNVE